MGRGRRPHWSAWLAGVGVAVACASAHAQSFQDLQGMSIEQLANIEVTSVSKRAESLSDAPAAIYIITHDQIVRSGATTIPEILRLAPNLQVAVISAGSYAITARGFNGNAANKLLVLVDGRSVYTPLFGGVLWDEVDIPPELIDRIEVISGPGATLWGANAVNGVINIITRTASATPGGVLDLNLGDHVSSGSLQYGGKLADDLSYRLYGSGLSIRQDKLSTGADAHDGLTKGQGGFRLDWTPTDDTVSLQGEYFHAREQQVGAQDLGLDGGHVQLDWRHALDEGAAIDVLAYYDEDRRFTTSANGFWLKTYDLEAQHSFQLGDRQQIVWGLGGRIYQSHFTNDGPVAYLPADRTETLIDGFAQDTVALTSSLDLIAGLKLEKDPFAGTTPLPNLRLSWKPTSSALVWAAVSRAVRAPTLFDVDLQDTVVPGVVVIQGDKSFSTEKLTAYELGARFRFASSGSLSVSTYYNVYDDLRSVELAPTTAPLPVILTWGNLARADTYGVEVWGDYQPLSWWRLNAGFKVQHLDVSFKPGASTLNSTDALGDDPNSQASLGSTVYFAHNVSWQADLRYVGALPNPAIPAYTELNSNLVWAVNDRWQLSLSGANLLHGHHLEYELAGATVGTEVPRSISIGTKLRF